MILIAQPVAVVAGFTVVRLQRRRRYRQQLESINLSISLPERCSEGDISQNSSRETVAETV
jgi:hypothetical protein